MHGTAFPRPRGPGAAVAARPDRVPVRLRRRARAPPSRGRRQWGGS